MSVETSVQMSAETEFQTRTARHSLNIRRPLRVFTDGVLPNERIERDLWLVKRETELSEDAKPREETEPQEETEEETEGHRLWP